MTKYLFSDFLLKFSKFFRITKETSFSNFGRQVYTWLDPKYRDFMTGLIIKLEPRYEEKHTIIADELEEINEINFINKGHIVVGYEINNEKRYCIKYSDCVVIGAYECQFNKRSSFIYTSLTVIEGFFVRKHRWEELMEDSHDIAMRIKRNLLQDYLLNIRLKVVVQKNKAISVMQTRHDQQMIKISLTKDQDCNRVIIDESLQATFKPGSNSKREFQEETEEITNKISEY